MSPSAATDEEADTGGRLAVPYVVVPLVAASMAAGLATLDPLRIDLGILALAGVGPLAAGVGLVGWTALTFRRASETLSPVAEPARLVTDGPLAYTRNPMYLGVLLAVGGVAVIGGSPVVAGYATLLALAYHTVVVLVEEPKLAEAFGEAYREYCASVPRWV